MGAVAPLPPRRPPGDSSPGVLMDDMQVIERELEEMKPDWSAIEEDRVRVTASIARVAAPKRLELKKNPPVAKPTKEDLDALVLDWLWTEHEDLMTRQIDAEAQSAGFNVIYRVSDKTLSSKQSRLKTEREAQGRAA